MITPRENMLRIFRHETPEWIPVAGHVDPYNQPNHDGMDPALAAALADVRWCDETTVAFSRHLGIDIMDYMSAPVRATRKNVHVETARDGADTIDTWHTPAGTLREARRQCRDDGTSYLVEHLVKSPGDLAALAAIFEDEDLSLDGEAVDAIAARARLIGDGGMLMCFTHGTPMGMMYRVYSGVETLAYLYNDAPRALGDLFAVMERSYMEQFRLATMSDLDVIVSMDDTSTTTISPAMFARFNLELTDRRADLCHEAGKLYFHHSCGLIRDLLPLYRGTRIDAVHAFTVPPIGNVTVAEGRRVLGNGITIVAGAAPMAEESWNVERMREGVRRLFADAGAGDHFIINLAAYPHRTMSQTRMLVDECRKYQKLGV